MFLVAYIRNGNPDDYLVIGSAETLAGARSIRKLAGDLVFSADGAIVQDTGWLWSWELRDPTCYARRSQAAMYRIAIRQPERQ